MRLAQLIHDLNELHADLGNVEVICSADDEGNNYGLLYGVFQVDYVKGGEYSGVGGYAGRAVSIQIDWWADVAEIHPDDVEEYRD